MTNFVLKWENISVKVALTERKLLWNRQTTQKTILENVSGEVCSNSLVAVMGSSGSGKTTFLGAISGRLNQKSGTLWVNSRVVSGENVKGISGYVHQNDVFMDSFTVFEELVFKVSLQMPGKSFDERKGLVRRLLVDLGLEKIKRTRVKWLSGGERRRLALAGELLSDPFILFCDEPTTGLDSYSAMTVTQKLQNIAESGKIVVATIHQPSSQVFDCFDSIMLLAQGKLVFQGSKEVAKTYFESMGLYCPVSFNPADFYIKCITKGDVSKMCEIFNLRKEVHKKVDIIESDHVIEMFAPKFQKSFCYELKWLTWRCFVDIRRDFSNHILRILLLMICGLFIALSYVNVRLSDISSAQNIQGVLFTIVSELIFTHMYAVIFVFPREMVIFLREKSLYEPLPYFISKLISLVPMCLLSALSYTSMFFIILNFLSGFKLWLQMLYISFVLCLLASCIGLGFSATFPEVKHIDLLMSPLELIFIMMSGFWLNFNSLSWFWQWLKYLSPFFYGFTSMSCVYWKDVTSIDNCTDDSTTPCSRTGTEVLREYGILDSADSLMMSILCIHGLILLMVLIGFAGILRRRRLHHVY